MKIPALILLMMLAAALGGFAQYQPLYNANILEKRMDTAMIKWRENRFGQFFHWGLYAVPGGEWNGQPTNIPAEWIMNADHISREDYAGFIHRFNPVHYDPVKWAAMDKQMGVRYVVLTTKHHEGFCLWPSRYTDFDIASTPYHKDLLAPFVQAYKKAGIDVYFYYSILDWHHPDYRSALHSDSDKVAFGRYMQYVTNQLTELLQKYPDIKGFWFDGQWDSAYISHPEYGWKLEKTLRSLKPGIILNCRIRSNEQQNRDQDQYGFHYGDYDASFERRLMSDSSGLQPDFDWEACMTIPENTWGYNKHWVDPIKSPRQLVEMLVKCTALSGNFLLNFGPEPDGTIRKEETDRAKAIGAWMRINHAAIYGAEGMHLPKQDWGYYTRRRLKPTSQVVYLNLFYPPASRQIHLPFQADQISSVTWLGHKDLPIRIMALEDGTAALQLPDGAWDPIADVIAVRLNSTKHLPL